jgi:hypothetical protein
VAGRPSVKPARTPPLIRELTLRGSPRLSASQPVGHNCAKVEERRRRSTSQPGVASLERTPGKRQLFMNTPKGGVTRRPDDVAIVDTDLSPILLLFGNETGDRPRIVKPLRGMVTSWILTQGALEDSRPWAELFNAFGVVRTLLPGSVATITCVERAHQRP